MGLRFQRRVRLAPGVSLNFSKSGVGFSFGPRGAKVGVGPRGAYYSLGIPGTGIAFREQVRGGTSSRSPRSSRSARSADSNGAQHATNVPDEVQLQLQLDGTLHVLTMADEPLPKDVVRLIERQHADEIRSFIEAQCARVNEDVERVRRTYLATPAPEPHVRFEAEPFTQRSPTRPTPADLSIFDRLVPGRRAKVEDANRDAERRWRQEHDAWQGAKAEHDRADAARRSLFERSEQGDEAAMAAVLEARLEGLEWPRETNVSYDFTPDGTTLGLDIDLPEVEDMPDRQARVAASGKRAYIKTSSATQVRKEYMRLVHGIVFRALGEGFHALPAVERIVGSGYSQRPDPATGRRGDDYLLSAVVDRATWQRIDFAHLADVDVIVAFERFDLRRRMSKTGVFKPIEPYALGESGLGSTH